MLTIARALLGVGFAGVLMGALKAFAAWFPSNRFATVSSSFIGVSRSAPGCFTRLAGRRGRWRALSCRRRRIRHRGRTRHRGGHAQCSKTAQRHARLAALRPRGITRPAPGASTDGFGLIVRDHRFWRIAFVNFSSLGVVLAVQGLWGAPYLSVVYGLGDLQVGNALVVLGIGVIIGNLACGWLSDRFGRGVVVLTGASVFLTSQALLALAPSGLPIGLTYLAFGLFSAYFVALVDEVRTVFPPDLTGRQ